MAFSEDEVKKAYLEDITKWCPKQKVKRVWRNSVKKRGKLSDEMVAYLDKQRG